MRLIDKDVIITELDKRKNICKKIVLDLRTKENIDYYQGKAEAYKETIDLLDTLEVKEVPEWKRATEDNLIGCLVWDERRHFHLYNDRVFKGELYISMGDILELPNSPIKNKYDRQSTENL